MSALPPDPTQYCSQLSAQAGEMLPGTASQATSWLLLEYRGIWGSKAFEEASLPQPVKDHLSQALQNLPAAKLQLIGQHARASQTGITFFVGQTVDRDPKLYEFHLDSYEELLDIDFAAVLAGTQPAVLRERPLLLVCTNGRRDACCARWGMPAYRAISASAEQSSLGPEAVWQTTHLGGHRLAPNVVCFPAGLVYGRVRPEDGRTLVDHCIEGEIWLDKLRGRSSYPPVVQAAERFLHEHTGCLEVAAYIFLDATEQRPHSWLVRFGERQGGRLHHLQLAVDVTSTPIRQSCGKEKTEPLVDYGLVEYGIQPENA